jgi:large subunit ribosomal protein L23
MALNIFKTEEGKGKKKETLKPTEEKKKEEVKSLDAKNSKVKKNGSAWKVLKIPHITEKATDLSGANQYVFNVYPNSNKKEVKNEVENVYGVNVVSVNIINVPEKKRRLGKTKGVKAGYKKAIVRIKAGQKIEVMPR